MQMAKLEVYSIAPKMLGNISICFSNNVLISDWAQTTE